MIKSIVNQLYLTICNCVKLRTFRHFKMLYDNVDIPIIRIEETNNAYIGYDKYTLNFIYIKIGKFETKQKLNTALLHEVGHLIDMSKKINYSYYFCRHNTKTREKQAWKESMVLSDKYNINICYEFAIRMLKSYGTEYRVLENRLKRRLT